MVEASIVIQIEIWTETMTEWGKQIMICSLFFGFHLNAMHLLIDSFHLTQNRDLMGGGGGPGGYRHNPNRDRNNMVSKVVGFFSFFLNQFH